MESDIVLDLVETGAELHFSFACCHVAHSVRGRAVDTCNLRYRAGRPAFEATPAGVVQPLRLVPDLLATLASDGRRCRQSEAPWQGFRGIESSDHRRTRQISMAFVYQVV